MKNKNISTSTDIKFSLSKLHSANHNYNYAPASENDAMLKLLYYLQFDL